jgi:hypothetical protein
VTADSRHAFGLDRRPVIAENDVRNDGELCAMLAADNCHRGVVFTNTAGIPTSKTSASQGVARIARAAGVGGWSASLKGMHQAMSERRRDLSQRRLSELGNPSHQSNLSPIW